jgi:hypothetical protein
MPLVRQWTLPRTPPRAPWNPRSNQLADFFLTRSR